MRKALIVLTGVLIASPMASAQTLVVNGEFDDACLPKAPSALPCGHRKLRPA